MRSNGRSLVYLIRRHCVLALLMFIVTFFLVPFSALVRFTNYAQYLRENRIAQVPIDATQVREMRNSVSNVLSNNVNQETLAFGFAGMGFLAAIILFRHLFTRRQAVLVAGLPVRRQEDFAERVIVYLVTCLFPVSVCLLLYPAFARITGMAVYMSGKSWMQIGVLILIHLYGFSLGTLACTLTGQIWMCVMGAVVLSAGAECFIYACQEIAVHYLYTLPLESAMSLIRVYSPAFSLYKTLGRPELFTPWAGVTMTVACLCLACVAYTRRATERAEHPIAFRHLEKPAAVVVSLIAGLLIGVVFLRILYNEPALYVSVIVGTVLAWTLCQMAFSFSVRSLFKTLPIGFACAAVLVIGIIGTRFDVFGYDRYVPNPDKLESISIRTDEGRDLEQYTVNNADARAAACTLAEMMRENTVGLHVFHDAVYAATHMSFTDGHRTVSRGYTSSVNVGAMPEPEKWSSAAEILVTSDEYRQGLLASNHVDEILNELDRPEGEQFGLFLTEQPYGSPGSKWNELRGREFVGYPRNYGSNMTTDQKKQLLLALKEDILSRSYRTISKDPVFSLQLYGRLNDTYFSSELSVYPDDMNTLRELMGDNAENGTELLTGGYAREIDSIVYKVTFDDVVADRFTMGFMYPTSWERVPQEQVPELIRQSAGQQYVNNYYEPAAGKEELWIFNLAEYYDYYTQYVSLTLDDSLDLVELVQDYDELRFWPTKRYVLMSE